MKIRAIRRLLPAIGWAAILAWGGASTALAQRYDDYGSNRALSRPAYEQMRQLAQQLDREAHETNDAAQHAQYSIYRRDTTFRRSVSSFARRADQFNYRMSTYRTRPWQVDDELRGMLRSAQDVQYRVQNSRYMDERILGEWNEVISVLNQMREVYRADLRGEYGRYGNPQSYGSQPYGNQPNGNQPYGNPPYRGGYAPPGPPPGGGHRYSRDQLISLAHELDDRATRAHELAERLATGGGPREQEFFGAIHHFNDETRDFRQRVESGSLAGPDQVRAEASHLLDDARAADARMRQNNVFPEVWREWQAAMQTLQNILNLVGA
jgi:uncharacterized protein YukE